MKYRSAGKCQQLKKVGGIPIAVWHAVPSPWYAKQSSETVHSQRTRMSKKRKISLDLFLVYRETNKCDANIIAYFYE